MFTGIVEELGVIQGIQKRDRVTELRVQADVCLRDTKIGDSISVNGVCLTVARLAGRQFIFEAVPETTRTTNLGGLRLGCKVNLERSLRLGDKVGGHFVTGHIDCVGIIRRRLVHGGNRVLEITFPAVYARYVLQKGSVAVDGISLTVARCRSNSLSVYIIPHTMEHTTLAFKRPSDKVNLEFDMLAKRRPDDRLP